MLKDKSKRVISFLIVITFLLSMLSTVTSAYYISNINENKTDKTDLNKISNFKEKLENINEKIQNLKNSLNSIQSFSDKQSLETKTSSFYNILYLFSALRTTGLTFYTNYKGIETNYNLKIFKSIKIDVNNDSIKDFSVRTRIYLGIELPLRISFNVKLIVNSLSGYDSLDENAFFKSYAMLSRPGILFKESRGDSICFGYESSIGDKIPKNIELIYTFVPNLFALRKTPEHKLQTDLKDEESNLSVIFRYASLENETIETEHNLKILYKPLKKSSISFGRTGSSSIEFKRDDSTSSYVTLLYEKRQDKNSTFFYVKDVPSFITFTADMGRDGLIEFNTHGETAEEIGIVDDFENPKNSVYFTNLFGKAGISWHRDRFLFITKGFANYTVYTDGKGVDVHVHLTGSDEGFIDFEAFSRNAFNCSFELNLDEGYLHLLRSSVDLSISFNIEIKNKTLGNFINKLSGSFDITNSFDGPFEILFYDLKSGACQINLAGKSLDLSNLILTGSSQIIGGDFTVSMEKLIKEKYGRINFNLSIEHKDNNITGSCCFTVENGVKITNLSLLYNNFEFHRENIDVSGYIVHCYPFSLNVNVEWHVYKDWGYILIKSGGFASLGFNSTYKNETGVLTGIIKGIISFKVINEDFNISWKKVDGNYTFSFDGSGVATLRDFNLWIKDKIEVSIPEISLSFEINTDAKEGSLKLYLDDAFVSGEVNIENINITDLYNITLKCSINAALDVSASGFIEIGWNESGITSINGDFGVDASGSIDITDFEFNFKDLVEISINRLFIDGGLNVNFSSYAGNLSIFADVDLTDIVISQLSVYCSMSTPLAISADLDITFDGIGFINIVYSNDSLVIDGVVYDDSDITVNSFWFIVPVISMEVNLDSVYITGTTKIIFNVKYPNDIPLIVTFYFGSEITADVIYAGLYPYLQIFVYDFIGGGTGGNMGIGFNMATSQPVFDFNHSSCFIGDLEIFLSGGIVIPISDLSLDGTAHIEGFLDLMSFSYLYLNGKIIDDTTITIKNLDLPVIGSCNVSIILEPGNFDILFTQDLLATFPFGNVYIYGYSSSWITIKIDNPILSNFTTDSDLVKFVGTLDLCINILESNDDTISAVVDAKEASGAIILMDRLRFAGEANALVEFSTKIVQDEESITISNLNVNISGELSAVVQIKTNETDWIPIIPFSYSGQVLIFRQAGFMSAPNIISDFEVITPDNASLIFEVWYSPPIGKDTEEITPYTYNVSFGDGTYYEVVTDDTSIVIPSHLYEFGIYETSVTVKTSNSSIDQVYDDIEFRISKALPTYIEISNTGLLEFTYLDVDEEGRIHTWFDVRNKDDDSYILEWAAEVILFGIDIEGYDPNPIVEPESGVLSPGESQRVNVSFYPPSDNKEWIGPISGVYFTVNNTNYEYYSNEHEDSDYKLIRIRKTLSVLPGSVYIPHLNPNESITSSIWIWNNKKDKPLNWTISDYPNDYYSFSFTEGTIPPGSAEIVHFTITAPEEDFDLSGEINVTDVDYPVFYGVVPINVMTKSQNSSNGNVTINEKPNGNVSIAIGGRNEININNFQFEINGIIGEINGHFIFDAQDSYVFINWTKGDLSNFSVDGNAEFSIENFAFSYGENISIVVSRVITGGFHCSQGRKGNFTLVVDDTFVDLDIDVHFNNSYSNFTLSGNIDIDIDSVTDGTLVINWDLEAETKDISIDGNLLHTSNMEVSITDFVLQFNNFTLNTGLLYFNRTVFISWNETSLTIESGSNIQAEDIYFSLNGDTQLITIDATVEIDGYVTFAFKPWNDGYMFCISSTGFKVNGLIYIEFGEYHGSANIFWKIVGWFCIGLETG